MPFFGAHMSIAGGCHKAIELALHYGCSTFQMFTKNASQWVGKPLLEDEAAAFRSKLKESMLKFATAHDSYLINLASPDDLLWKKSIDAFVDEIDRAERLGLAHLVTHPGAHMNTGEPAGVARVVEALDIVCDRAGDFKVKVLIETTAGQGTTLGARFEHLRDILGGVKATAKFGICLDTCHVLAAGYPLAPAENYAATFEEFHKVVGIKHLKCFHLNDSKKPLGSRVDRHEHLGKGHVGIEAFRMLVNDPRFAKHPMILETPKEEGGRTDMDKDNLAVLGELAGNTAA